MKKLLLTLLLAAAAMPGWAEKYPSKLHVAGNATTAGWLSGTSTLLYQVSEKKYEGFVSFTGTEGGEVKFLCQADWKDHWGPSSNGTAVSGNGTLALSFCEGGSPDNKFKPTISGLYLVTIDVTTGGSETATFTQWTSESTYEIGTAGQLSAYADCINKFDQTVKANLTADINMTDVAWTPIGQDGKDFRGQFNGQGHRIMNLTTNASNINQALFGQAVTGAIIENVIIDASCTIQGTKFTAGILGHVWGDDVIVRNCGNEADVTGSGANAAGIVGCSEKKVTIQNCYNTGHITGNAESAAICAWMGSATSTIDKCYNIGAVTGQQDSNRMYRRDCTATNLYDIDGVQGESFTDEQLESGELCYTLNGDQSSIIWYQTIDTDAHPVPFSDGGHRQVYGNGELRCDGTSAGGDLVYSNSSESNIPPHNNENGWCTVCGTLDEDYLAADGEGFYSIGTANDLYWFAQVVNTVNQSAKAKLTADIDYTDYKQGWIGASQGKAFSGTFDGQEHTLTIDIVNTDLGQTGLFAYFSSATIKNLIVEGSATSAGNNCVGGLGGRGDGSTSYIQNVIVKTNVSFTGTNDNKDATCGGLFASIHGTAEITNCAFLGSITVPDGYQGNGGLVGWAGSGSNNKYTNCLVAPTAYNKTGDSEDYARNNPKVTNCSFTSANDAKLASGELCYRLNGDQSTIGWYQNLSGSVDAYPVPFSTHSQVYANGSFNCDGTPKVTIVYGNTDDEHHDSHTLGADGFCSVCSAWMSYVSSFMTPAADGYYEIANNKQMRWFAAMIKDYRNAHSISSNDDANAPVNARLMGDIDFTGIKDFEPIGGLWGQGSTRYAGTFDGQHHKITNLVVDLDKDNVGVFGVIAEGAVIKNFTLDSSCSITGNGHVGIVGEIWRSHDGEVHLESLGNEANITGNGNNVGGILGVNMNNSGYAKLYMTNCYSTGIIKGNDQNGQLSGWTGDGAVVKNCYATGDMVKCEGFARLGGGSVVINGYCDKDLTWGGHPTKVTSEQIASGALCAKLGFGFRQTIGSGHPCFDQEKGFVAQIGAAGYSTMYNTYSDVTIPSGVTAYAGEVRGEVLSLSEIEDKIKAGEPVVLEGSEGLYNFTPTTGASKAATNDLLGSDGSVTGGAGIYALAKKGEPATVGFYLVGSGVTIPEGKAYISSGAGIKGFVFEFDDATSIEEVLSNSPLKSENIFNLAGQRIQKMQKGINIVNGKKVLR